MERGLDRKRQKIKKGVDEEMTRVIKKLSIKPKTIKKAQPIKQNSFEIKDF